MMKLPITMRPNYQDGSIVNLMSSLEQGLGGQASSLYPPLTLLSPDTVAKTTHLVLLIIDGLGYHYFRRHGTVFKTYLHGGITSVFPTSTAPAVTTFLTGVAPQQHGVTGWFMYFKELGMVSTILPFRPRCGPGTLDQAGIKVRDLIAYPSLFDRLDIQGYCIVPQTLVNSPYTVAGAGRAERRGYSSLEDCFSAIVQTVSRDTERRYVYAYWPMFDTLAHRYGVAGQPVKRHFFKLEQKLAVLAQNLQGTDTLLIVTADHGFIDTTPRATVRLEAHPDLADCLALPLCGEPRLAYGYIRAGRRERFEQYIRERLADCCELYSSEALLEQGWFGKGEPEPRLRDRIGDYVLLSKGNYVIKDRLPTEPYWADVGVHGGVAEDEMYVPLVVVHC